jgi:hypothetical protein
LAITITAYDSFKAEIIGGPTSGEVPIDFLSDTIKLALVTSTYTPNMATHDFWNDISANELTATNGYVAQTLASKTVAVATSVATADAADPVFPFSGPKTWRYGVLFKDTGTTSTSPLMWLLTWDSDQTVSTPYTVVLAATGIWTIT